MNSWDSRSLSSGINIDILRSDGRVHSAIVKSVNRQNATVTVEWFEKGEAKGKEVDLKAVRQLNPTINFSKEPPDSEAPLTSTPLTTNNNENFNPLISTDVNVVPPVKGIIRSNQPPLLAAFRSTNNLDMLSFAIEQTEKTEFNTTELQNNLDVHNEKISLVNSSFGWIKGGNSNKCANNRMVTSKDTSEKTSSSKKEERKVKHIRKHSENEAIDAKDDFQAMIREFQKTLNMTPLISDDLVEPRQICVCVRKRPLSSKELKNKEIDVITIPNKQQLIVHEPKLKVDLTKYLENQHFRFDYAFDQSSDNRMVYHFTAKPLVECIFEGGMATCFAYGQTGSGKTHTMGGEFLSKGVQNYSNGIYALTANDVFKLLNTRYKLEELSIECSYFEIYSGKVFDLLNNKNQLRVLEDHRGQVQIVGLKTEAVEHVEGVLSLLQQGMSIRTSGQTSANQQSSRSHAVFQLMLKKKTGRLRGKFSLIDLAGNERGADTDMADRTIRREGAEINKSLLALKECIRALGRRASHRPFRASKLTQVLRDSFIGDQSRTCMISMISPGIQSCEHTLNTLRYADRVKELSADAGILSSDDSSETAGSAAMTPRSGSGDHNNNIIIKNEDDCVTVRENVGHNKNDNVNTAFRPDFNFLNESIDEPTVIFDNDISDKDSRKLSFCEKSIDLSIENTSTKCTVDKENVQNETTVKSRGSPDVKLEDQEDEDLQKNHETIIKKLNVWSEQHHDILRITYKKDFDATEYTKGLIRILSEQIEDYLHLKEKIKSNQRKIPT